MPVNTDSVTIEVRLRRDQYDQVEAQALKEHRALSEVIPDLLSAELRRRLKARRLFEQVSDSYRARLAAEGKLAQTPEEVLEELRVQRERIANELYPE